MRYHSVQALRGCGGLTLVELMVALLLGSILSLAAAHVYLESARDQTAGEELAQLQSNGRFALELVRRELRLAGFIAGANGARYLAPASVSTDCTPGGQWALDTRYPVDFIDNFPGGAMVSAAGDLLDCILPEDVLPGTDIVIVKRTAAHFTARGGDYVSGARRKAGQWYVQVDDSGGSPAWLYDRRGGLRGLDVQASYWAYFARILYIRKYSRSPADGVPSLCVESLVAGGSLGKMSTRCLVEGVEDLQVELGVDRNADSRADEFVGVTSVADLRQGVAARVHLLVRSIHPLPGLSAQRRYQLGTRRLERNDRYLRRVLSTTVSMPNLGMARG